MDRHILELAIARVDAEHEARIAANIGCALVAIHADLQATRRAGWRAAYGDGCNGRNQIVRLSTSQCKVVGANGLLVKCGRSARCGCLVRSVDEEIDVADVVGLARRRGGIGFAERDQRAGRQADGQIVGKGRSVGIRLVQEQFAVGIVVNGRRCGVGPIPVESVGRRLVDGIIEVDGTARQVVRRAPVERVRLLGDRSPVSAGETREQLGEDVSPLIVGRDVECIRGGWDSGRGATAGDQVGLRQVGVLPERRVALSRRVEVRFEYGLAEDDVALGLAGLARDEHEIGVRRPPSVGSGVGRQLNASDQVIVVRGVVVDAQGVRCALEGAVDSDVGQPGERIEVGIPDTGRIGAESGNGRIGRRNEKCGLGRSRVPQRARRDRIEDVRCRCRRRGVQTDQLVGHLGTRQGKAARVRRTVGVFDTNGGIAREAGDPGEIARVRARAGERVFELGIAEIPERAVGRDVADRAADSRRQIRMCGDGFALEQEKECPAAHILLGCIGERHLDVIIAAGRIQSDGTGGGGLARIGGVDQQLPVDDQGRRVVRSTGVGIRLAGAEYRGDRGAGRRLGVPEIGPYRSAALPVRYPRDLLNEGRRHPECQGRPVRLTGVLGCCRRRGRRGGCRGRRSHGGILRSM